MKNVSCRICKKGIYEVEKNHRVICGHCMMKKTLETYPYDQFKPKESKIKYCKCCSMFEIGWKKKLKKKRAMRDLKIVRAKAKISKWNKRLQMRKA